MADIVERLRTCANDLYSTTGETMKRWDIIRHSVETRKGSDEPRLIFESLIEDFADRMIDGAAEIERLRAALRPFAALVDAVDCTTDHEYTDDDCWEVKIGHLRDARAAIEQLPSREGE